MGATAEIYSDHPNDLRTFEWTRREPIQPSPREKPSLPCYEITREDRQVELIFRLAVEEWRRQSKHLSSIRRMLELPSYKRIIGLGRPAIPLVLRELEERPSYWFSALRALTGEKEIANDKDFQGACEAWIAWGRANGYLHATRLGASSRVISD
jgi:hypothetical protein